MAAGMDNLVSIVVPIYNVEKYLDKCVKSICNQTYTNLEIILVDDGSPDKCGKMCDEYAQNDDRIKVVHKKNGGLSDARNAGIRIATGKYLFLVDSDDYIREDTIALMYDRIEKDNADICICDIAIVDENGQKLNDNGIAQTVIESKIYNQEDMYERIITTPNWFFVVAWNKLYKREIFDNISYPKGRIHEDELTIHYIVEKCNKITTLNEKLYFYVQRNQSIMHDGGYKVKNLDIVQAFGDRAYFFIDHNENERAFRMLVRMRTVLLDGYIALRNDKSTEKKNRINELYKLYCDLYDKIDKNNIESDKISQMKRLRKSLLLAVYTSGNFWNNIK